MTAPNFKRALALAALAAAAGCSSGAPGEDSKGHGQHQSGAKHGGDKAAAELAFLFPDGEDRGWAKFTKGHGHGDAAQVPLVKLAPPVRARLIHQLSLTAGLVARYPTVKSAEAAGYRRSGPFVPGIGAHYMGGVTGRSGTLTDEDILKPSALLYAGTSPDSELTGFMYAQDAASDGAAAPEGFAGPNDQWHRHAGLCTVQGKDGKLDIIGNEGALSEAECKAKGGSYLKQTQFMVHVWTVPAYTNPLGVFAARNPAVTCPDGTYHSAPNDTDNFCVAR